MCGIKDYKDACNHWNYENHINSLDYIDPETDELRKYYDYIKELDSTLKHCPFCSDVAAIFGEEKSRFRDEWFVVECQKCGVSTPYCKTPEQAAETWNTRVYVG